MSATMIIDKAIERILGPQPFDYDRYTRAEIEAVRMLQCARKWVETSEKSTCTGDERMAER